MPEISVERSLDVPASPETVWEWMCDVKSWSQWKPIIRSSSVVSGSGLEQGALIKFKPKMGPVPLNLKVRIIECKPGRKVTWKGSGPGISGVHSFEFEDIGEGKTRVVSKETFSGFGVHLLKRIVPERDLIKLHEDWLNAIKKRAESEK